MNNIFHGTEKGCWEKCLMVHATSSFKVPYFSKSGKSDNMFSLNGTSFSVHKRNFFVSQLNYYAHVVHIKRSMISSKYTCCTCMCGVCISSDFKTLIMAKKISHSLILFILHSKHFPNPDWLKAHA